MTLGPDMALGDGAEFRMITRLVRRWGSIAGGIGDDAALLHVPRDNALVASTDTSVDGVHFRRDWLSADEIGYRAATAAISDLAAMGAAGTGLLVALTLTDDDRALVDGLARGIGDAARAAGMRICGGDTTRGPTLSLTITVLGHVREPLHRDAARAGHRVYVTGVLGGPAAALASFERGETPADEHRARFAHPVARLAEARWLAGQGARAAIDVSDGLVADAGHIAAASDVRLVLDLDKMPRMNGVDADDAISSGEEYELLVTSAIPIDTLTFEKKFRVPLTEIGVVRDGAPDVVLVRGNEPTAVARRGYDHFAS